MILLKKLIFCLLLLSIFWPAFISKAEASSADGWVEMKYDDVMLYERISGELRPYMRLNSSQPYALKGSASENWYKLDVDTKEVYIAKIRVKKAEAPSTSKQGKQADLSITTVRDTPIFVSPSYDGKVIASLLKDMTYAVSLENEQFYIINIAGVKGFIAKSMLMPESDDSPYAAKVPVLMYHHLLRQEENSFPHNNVILNVENFEQQMKYLAEQGYTPILAEELVLFMEGELRLPKKSVLITFDDGHKTNYLYAYPILKKYNMRAAAFVITNRIKLQPAAFDPVRLQFLSKPEIESMKDVFEFGSHTNGLHNLEGMTSHVLSKPAGEVLEDFIISRSILQTSYFCYPFGQYTPQTISLLQQAGYQAAFSTKEGYAKPNGSLFEIPRFGIYPYTTMDEFKDIVTGLK
jgi:peptidoglycan/xylan/chitin deacetylase (PgdA/CDA1 family)